MFEGETLSTGASFSSRLAAECLRGGTGLIVCVIAKEIGRSLSRMFSCPENFKKKDECTTTDWHKEFVCGT